MSTATFGLVRMLTMDDFAHVYQLMTAGDRHTQMLYADPSYDAWLRLANGPDAWPYLILADGEPCGCTIINGHNGRSAFIHFCTFFGCDHLAVGGGKYVLEWLFSEHKTSIIGVTPSIYRHVLRYIKSVGLKVQFIVPDGCYIARHDRYCNSVVTMITHKNWEDMQHGA